MGACFVVFWGGGEGSTITITTSSTVASQPTRECPHAHPALLPAAPDLPAPHLSPRKALLPPGLPSLPASAVPPACTPLCVPFFACPLRCVGCQPPPSPPCMPLCAPLFARPLKFVDCAPKPCCENYVAKRLRFVCNCYTCQRSSEPSSGAGGRGSHAWPRARRPTAAPADSGGVASLSLLLLAAAGDARDLADGHRLALVAQREAAQLR